MRQFHDQSQNVEAALQYASRLDWAVLPKRGKKFYTRDGDRRNAENPFGCLTCRCISRLVGNIAGGACRKVRWSTSP
jgi:hypothetical protein